jgi:signal transduction histidine kinase
LLGYHDYDFFPKEQAEQELGLLTFALDNVREATFLIDENTCFLSVNEDACRNLGHTRDELLMEITTIDLHTLSREVADMMQLRAQQKGLWLRLNQSPEFPHYIKCGEARLRQILVNLLGNAVKFTTEGGVTLRLGVKQNEPRQLVIEFEDTGSGISEADIVREISTSSGEVAGLVPAQPTYRVLIAEGQRDNQLFLLYSNC